MEYSHRKIFWGTALVLAAALCLLLTVAPSAGAASSSELKKQLQQLQEEQAELQSQIEALESQQQDNVTEIGQIVAEKSNLDQQVGLLYQQAQVLDQQISAYNVLIADKQEELDEAQERLDELTARNKERLRAMEEDGSLSYWSVLFNSSSFSEFLDQLSMMEEIAASDQRRLEEMSAASEEVARAKKVLAAERAELESKKAESEALQAELDVKQAEADELLARLLEKGGELEALMEEMERQEQELLASIGAKQDELDEAKKAEYQQWLSTSEPDPKENVSASGWIKPCTYRRVSSAYGYRTPPTEGASTFHAGIDLAGPEGTNIYAAKSGTVTAVYYDQKGGWTIKINHHDGFSSAYLHMKSCVAKQGDIVAQGQLIGYMGSTGTASTGSHLHFSIYYNGKSVNPADYIDF